MIRNKDIQKVLNCADKMCGTNTTSPNPMVPLDPCEQYEVVGYLGMILCAVYLGASFYLLREMSRNRKFSNQKDLQKIILILLILFNAFDFPQYQVPQTSFHSYFQTGEIVVDPNSRDTSDPNHFMLHVSRSLLWNYHRKSLELMRAHTRYTYSRLGCSTCLLLYSAFFGRLYCTFLGKNCPVMV